MYNRITDIVFKENLRVIVTFQSGEVKEYDFKRLSSSYPPYKRLEQEPELFMNTISVILLYIVLSFMKLAEVYNMNLYSTYSEVLLYIVL